jgi:hypothetical protein
MTFKRVNTFAECITSRCHNRYGIKAKGHGKHLAGRSAQKSDFVIVGKKIIARSYQHNT